MLPCIHVDKTTTVLLILLEHMAGILGEYHANSTKLE